MIIQQTLSRREKIVGMFGVLFLLGLVAFGYNQTVINPAQASVLHSEKIEENYSTRYQELTMHFDAIRENITVLKSTSVKSKLRSIKGCLLDAQVTAPKEKPLTAQELYSSCEKLFIETETEIDAFTSTVKSLETSADELESNVKEYEHVVEQALTELKKKNDATLGEGAGH